MFAFGYTIDEAIEIRGGKTVVENDVKSIFAKNVLKLRKHKNLTQKELGEELELGKTTISQWESAQKLPNAGSIEKIASFFNVPKSALFELGNGQFSSYGQMVNLPVVGKISCGNGVLAYEEITSYEPTPEEWVNNGEYFYLNAEGDSMTGARIHNGDLVLIRMQDEVEDGEIAAVLIGENVYLKRVYKQEGSLILQSENPAYPPIFAEPKEDCLVKIIGKLKRVILVF